MKRIIIFALIVVTSMMLAGCKEKEEPKEKDATEEVQDDNPGSEAADAANDQTVGGAEAADTGVDGESVLCTDDKSISIIVLRPEGFEDSEFSSEHQVAFQRLGADGVSSTQLNYRLIDKDENAAMTEAQQEVEYLLSANSDGSGVVDGVQSQAAGDRQWSYFTYSMEGLEGCRLWTSLANGCVLSCTAENMGSGLEPLAIDNLMQMLGASIRE